MSVQICFLLYLKQGMQKCAAALCALNAAFSCAQRVRIYILPSFFWLCLRSNTCYSHICWHRTWARRRCAGWTRRGASAPWRPPSLRPWPWAARCSGRSPGCCSWRGTQTDSGSGRKARSLVTRRRLGEHDAFLVPFFFCFLFVLHVVYSPIHLTSALLYFWNGNSLRKSPRRSGPAAPCSGRRWLPAQRRRGEKRR